MLYDNLRMALQERAKKSLLVQLEDYDSPSDDIDPVKAWRKRQDQVDFSSNDILSIARNSHLSTVFKTQITNLSVSPFGSTGSRTTSGNTPFHVALEKRLAKYYDSEAVVLFNSGFDANMALWGTLPQLGDAIVYDELVHASIREGLSRTRAASTQKFAHNSLQELERLLKSLVGRKEYVSGECNVFVAVEALYSVDGDLAPLRDLIALVRGMFPNGNSFVIVDEAHTTGLYGDQGRGLCSSLALEIDCPIRLHTFGKAIGLAGAVIVCPQIVRTYLINYCRVFRFSTSSTISHILAINIAFDQILEPETVQKSEQALKLSKSLRRRLSGLGFQLSCLINENTPITGVFIDSPRRVTAWLREQGVLVSAITFPVVPKGTDRLRVCTHAHNNFEEVETLVCLLVEWKQKRRKALL